VLFIDFPPVLQLQLKRFEYDFMRDTMVKVCSQIYIYIYIYIYFSLCPFIYLQGLRICINRLTFLTKKWLKLLALNSTMRFASCISISMHIIYELKIIYYAFKL
jgi:hypothetical protein